MFGLFKKYPHRKLYLVKTLILISVSGLLAQENPSPGTRIDLTRHLGLSKEKHQFAQLFIPDYFKSQNFTLVFHFHGASWVIEQVIYQTGQQAILFNIHLGLFSSPYRRYFSEQNRFQDLLLQIREHLSNQFNNEYPEINQIILTSFSAGYAGIREILKNEDDYKLIDGIILADGLHADSSSEIYPTQMINFVRFARDACKKEKMFYLTHSSIPTPGYMSTTETAEYLLNSLKIKKKSLYDTTSIGMQIAVCDTGYFYLESYAGESASDHMQHFYHLHRLLVKVPKF